MPTVIDALVVTLGLDPKQLNAQSGAATKKLKDLERQGGDTEESVKKIGSTSKETASELSSLTRAVGSFLAVIGGTMAIKRFITDQIESNAQLYRFSKNLGLSVSTVSAWGNAVEEMGGSAKGLQGTLDMLSKSQTELRLTGQSALIPYFAALGVSLANVKGQARPVDEILLDLADRFSKMDRTTANNMGRMMGIDQDTLNLLLEGRKEVELMIARQKESNAVTKQQAEQSAKLQRQLVDLKQSFTATGRALLAEATPALEKLLNGLIQIGSWIAANREFIGDFLKVMAVGLAAVGLAALPINGVVVAVVALGAAIAALWQDYQTWKRGGDSFIDWGVWKDRIDAVTNSLTKLKNELRGLDAKAEKAISKIPGYDKINKWYMSMDPNKPGPSKVGAAVSGALGINTGGSGTATGAQIQKYFMSQGWSAAQAAGIAANLMAESNGNARATGDSGSAFGLGQWHADRQAAFAQMFGHNIKNSTLAEQLAFVQKELMGSESGAGNSLRKAMTAQEAGAIVSRLYERPRDTAGEASRRGTAAQALLGVSGASSTVTAAGGGVTAGGNDNSTTVHVGEIKVYTAATDAPGIARDIGGSMDFLFPAQANTGLN